MKRSDNIARSQFRVGIFVVVALILFALGVLLMGEETKMFTPKGRISVIMNNVAGLKAGAPVWLAGVDIGVVRSIRFERPEATNLVEIILEVDRKSLKKIGKDSVITIKTRGLMGEKYVDITPSRHLVMVPETRVYGTNLPTMDDVIQKATMAFDHLNTTMDKVVHGQGSMGQLIADPKLYQNLSKLTAELNEFVTAANHGQGTLGQLNRSPELYERLVAVLGRADETLRGIQQADGTINKLIYDRTLYDNLVTVSKRSGDAAEDIHALSEKLISPEGSIGRLVKDREFYDKGIALIDRADKSVKSLEEVMDRVKTGKGTAGKLVNEQVLYDKMQKALEDLDLLLKDIQQNPRRYFKFSVF